MVYPTGTLARSNIYSNFLFRHKKPFEMQDILKKIINSPLEFTATDSANALRLIMSDQATQGQIGAFLLGFEYIPKTPEILSSLAKVLLSFSTINPAVSYNCADIVGTGGDGHNTFNVSTAASIIAAGAGCKVAKVRITLLKLSTEIALLLVIADLQIF